MRSIAFIALLCAPLSVLTGCPSDDLGDDGPADSSPSTSGGTTESPGDETNTTGPDTADTDPPPATGTETDTLPPETDSDTEIDSDTDTNGMVPGCECILDEHNMGTETPAAPTCGEALCGHVGANCSGQWCDPKVPAKFVLDDPETLTCALTALRDRTPGIVTWSLSELGGQYEDHGYVLVKDDGTAVRRNWGWSDLDYDASDARLGELRSPEQLDVCLADPDALARFDCLRSALASVGTVCDGGWHYMKF